ncbi:MAG TPA: hypothetical protein VK828_16135 [Terriglobales bacterium]|jgi:hypothetical protein|nr:hypothetical protein [Terriglobales bacterium]
MNKPSAATRYNQRIPHMRARTSSGRWLGWLSSVMLATALFPSFLSASSLSDAARQLANKIAAASGPGAFSLELTNRSSLDEKSVREVRSGLEAQLHVEGVHISKAEQATGAIQVVLSESLSDYVWTAVVAIGSDEKKVALVFLPRPPAGAAFVPAMPIVLKTTLLFAQEQPVLDVAMVDMPGGSRLIVLGGDEVSIYRHQGASPSGNSNSIARWEQETSLPITHGRAFPRDLRGRLLLRRDHLFDAYVPGVVCRSTANVVAPLTLACSDTDDPWPLTPDDSVRAFYASRRNFFTGALSPGIGKISNVSSFYGAAALQRPSYTLWAFSAVDGSLHLVDGITDQAIRGATLRWGSDLAAVHSSCGSGTQLLVSGSSDTLYDALHDASHDSARDSLRAFEIPDRDLVAVSAGAEFDGRIVALWPDSSGTGATAIVRRKDTGWYEAYRVSVTCGN